jgi:hypothetical protein
MGNLYILNEASKPSAFVTLFPSPTANEGSSLAAAGREIAIPQESWLQFAQELGDGTALDRAVRRRTAVLEAPDKVCQCSRSRLDFLCR